MTTLTAFAPPSSVSVIRLTGELGVSEMDSLSRALNGLLSDDRRRIVLNFNGVSHVSLGGIAKLAERNLRFKSVGGELKLTSLKPYVENLFNLVGANTSFDITATEEEAVARFENG
jgi:anti-sigma B factor antagonist